MDINILQANVATHLSCGEIINDQFIVNLLLTCASERIFKIY